MKTAEKIRRKIKRIRNGIPFRYEELGLRRSEYGAATKAIERLIRNSVIQRASSGLFFKPRKSLFGELPPAEEALLNSYLFKNGRRIAYVTGTALYNRMGLTTQVPKAIRVASRGKRVSAKIGSLLVKPVKSYVDVTEQNFQLLEILDALKDFKTIPDLDKKNATTLLQNEILNLSGKEKAKLVSYCLQYPPRVRAFLGALLESMSCDIGQIKLRESLNPLSRYRIGLGKGEVPAATDWNID